MGVPLAIVRNGDRIVLNVEARRLELLIADEELEQRLVAWKQSQAQREGPRRGYARLFEDCVLQADQGCDFDFLLRDGARTKSKNEE